MAFLKKNIKVNLSEHILIPYISIIIKIILITVLDLFNSFQFESLKKILDILVKMWLSL